MSDDAPLLSDAPPAADPGDWAGPMAERQLQMLGRLAEAGLQIAIALEAQAKGGAEVVSGDVAMAYNRVARAVRQTLLLQSKLMQALRDQAQAKADRKSAAKASAARILRRAIEDGEGADAERAERLAVEAAERLGQEDFSDLLARPFAEIVAAICKDLGLGPDWLQLAEDCHAAEAAFSGKPGAVPEEEPYDGPIKVRWLDSLRSADSS